MAKMSIANIVKKATELKTDQEKIDWLKLNESIQLRTILKYMYDKEEIKFLIPDTPPHWKKNGLIDIEGLLYKEVRRLKIFVSGGGYDNLNQTKRESLFISLLEDLDDGDAELLCKMIQQKPLKGLKKSVILSAFPQDYKESVDKSK